MILSRIRILPAERFDLEDLNGMMSAARTDSKYSVKKLLSNLNYVINGFTVTGLGLQSATVNMTNGTLIIPQNTNDFSWFTTAPTDPNVTIPDADLVDGVRNYVEIELLTENNTPVTRAFWDPEANSGAGVEFNQIVDTITDLAVNFVVLQGGFSGSPDRLPLCMIDTDGSGTIKSILDERRLFHRLGTPSNANNQFSWGTKTEPPYTLTLTGVVGTFISGEVVNLGSETAVVVTGGTSTITVQLPSSKNFSPGDTVTGVTSAATGTLDTCYESFSGVDKSISNLKEDLDAIKTELLLIKNPSGFWWSTTESIVDLRADISAIEDMLQSPSYDEKYTIAAPITAGTILTIPLNTRLSGSPQQFYIVGKGALEVFLNGQRISQNEAGGWLEDGTTGLPSSTIEIDQALVVGDLLEFRLALGGMGASGGGGGVSSLNSLTGNVTLAAGANVSITPSGNTLTISSTGGGGPAGDFNALSETSVPQHVDTLGLYDDSLAAYRKIKRGNLLSVAKRTVTANTSLTYEDDLILVDATSGNITITLPDASLLTGYDGKRFDVKKIDSSANTVTIQDAAGNDIDFAATFVISSQGDSVSLIKDQPNSQYWMI